MHARRTGNGGQYHCCLQIIKARGRGSWHYCTKMWLPSIMASLEASPDGLVQDTSAEDTEGLLELKYIQMGKQESLEEALVRKGICKKCEDGVTLNVRHK